MTIKESVSARYITYKYNNGHTHQLDEFKSKDDAIESAKALHNPDWPDSQGINVWFFEADEFISTSDSCVFDTNN